MARVLKLSKYDIVGRLFALWCWLDANTETGEDMPITDDDIDDMAECSGLAQAMRSAGWLAGEENRLTFPNFTRHNGESAKKRAIEAERKRLQRNGKRRRTGQKWDNVPDNVPGKIGQCPKIVPQKMGPDKDKDKDKDRDMHPNFLPPLFPAIDQVERQIQNDVFSGRLKIDPGQVRTLAEIYWASRDAVNWTRNGTPVTNWQSDLRSYALNWSRNNPVSAPAEDPYAHMDIL